MKKAGLFTILACLLHMYGASQDFEVGPAKLLFDAEPGQIQSKTLFVRNHSNTKQQFVLLVGDMKMDTSKTIQKLKSCAAWITLNPSFFEINPNESKDVNVILQVPPGESSTKGAMIFVNAAEEKTALGADIQMKSSIKVSPRIAVKVIQSPKSNTNYLGNLSDLKETTSPKDSLRTFQVKVFNSGDKMIDGKLYLVLSNIETGKEVKQKPERVYLFPGASSVMTLRMPATVLPGKYSLAAILDYGNNSSLEAVQMNVEVK